MLYRSPATRWILALGGIIAGLTLVFGSAVKWRSAPSLSWLGHAPLPLQFWGFAFVIYGLLLLPAKARAWGFALGFVLFGVFTVSLFATLDLGSDEPKNAIALLGMVDVTAFHAYSIKNAEYVREFQSPRRPR
jgi:hypothetical protein